MSGFAHLAVGSFESEPAPLVGASERQTICRAKDTQPEMTGAVGNIFHEHAKTALDFRRLSDFSLETRGARAMRATALALAMAIGGSAFSQPTQVQPEAQSFRLGGLQFSALRDSQNAIDNDGKVIGVEAGPTAVSAALEQAGASQDKVTLDIDALLVRAQGRVMLFDTGLGPGSHGALMGSLEKLNISARDVTDVFITHSHFDHVGGLATGDGHLAFPNATIHMSVREWAWMQSQPSDHDLVALVGPKISTFRPGIPIVPGVTAVALYGHTPGHVGYEIQSQGKRLMDVGDVVHSPIISLKKPGWAIGFDNDRKLGEATRKQTLTRLAATGEWVFAPHFPFPGIGRIQAAGIGFNWLPMFPGAVGGQ
jgi:glyoxylase-like metal-dependent hydrolase (beta-lactamase superfamily II)